MEHLTAHCEDLALELGRAGAFVEMTYRLFPATRNSFTPNLLELGFDFDEMRQVTAHTEFRFRIFPPAITQPLKKELEDLRTQLRAFDEGPFDYTGAPFLRHQAIERFGHQVDTTRRRIRAALQSQLIDNYDRMRSRAYEELRGAIETFLPGLGITNTRSILNDRTWFDQIFPTRDALNNDLRLHIHMINVHPTALLQSETLRREVERYLQQPEQLCLF